MKNMLEKVKNTKGFVSLEVIAIAVIVIALAAFVMLKFRSTAKTTSASVDTQISNTVDSVNAEATATADANK